MRETPLRDIEYSERDRDPLGVPKAFIKSSYHLKSGGDQQGGKGSLRRWKSQRGLENKGQSPAPLLKKQTNKQINKFKA